MRSDREWFVPVAAVVTIETLLWCAAFLAGDAARPMIVTYGSIALTFFTLALCFYVVRLLVRERPERPIRRLIEAAAASKERILIAVIGSQVLAFGSAAFGSLKAGIPRATPFWLDHPLGAFEGRLFGGDAWAAFHALFGWAVPLFDKLYATFVGTHVLAVLALLAAGPSLLKSRALVSLALAWLVLGVAGAYALSSAGPIFFDRLYGGDQFAALTTMLSREAPIATFTADALWAMHQSGAPRFGNGISAMPSMHVALTLWLALILNRTRFAPFGWAYYALIWVGSVLLGWHWFVDGLVGSAGMLALWAIAPRLLFRSSARAESATVPTAPVSI
jgi:hypothetical protein